MYEIIAQVQCLYSGGILAYAIHIEMMNNMKQLEWKAPVVHDTLSLYHAPTSL